MGHARLLLENMKVGSSQRIMLPTLEGFEIVPVSSILYCEANDNFTNFFLDDRDKLMICRPLKYFEDILKGHRFLRIHRSFVINPDYVVRYSKGKGGAVTMKNGQELEISANKKAEFLELFTK
jgi:two-component system, LytTR family, response regulator